MFPSYINFIEKTDYVDLVKEETVKFDDEIQVLAVLKPVAKKTPRKCIRYFAVFGIIWNCLLNLNVQIFNNILLVISFVKVITFLYWKE